MCVCVCVCRCVCVRVCVYVCVCGVCLLYSSIMWLHSKNFMDPGVDLSWVSAFPHEAEYLYPTLSYLKPTSDKPIVVNVGGTAS